MITVRMITVRMITVRMIIVRMITVRMIIVRMIIGGRMNESGRERDVLYQSPCCFGESPSTAMANDPRPSCAPSAGDAGMT